MTDFFNGHDSHLPWNGIKITRTMIKMELDRTGPDECTRWSPTTSSTVALNRSPRTYDLEREPGFLLTRRKRKMDRSASPHRDSAVANRGGSEYTYLPSKGELEEREILRESKRARYLDHHRNESFAEPSEQRYFSHERLPRRHETYSRREEEHEHLRSSRASPKGRYRGGTTIKSSIHVPEDESRESIYQRRDSDASFGQRQPHRDTNVSLRYLGKSHHPQAEGYSSFPQGMRHNRADRQSCDYKDGYSVKHDSGLSRSGLKPRDEITANDAHRSLKWRSHDDKTSSPRKHCKSLSRNEPKWDEETTDMGAPHSTKMSNKVSWGNNIESDSRLSWNGPKWGEKTTSKDSPTFSKWGEETTSKNNYVCDKEVDNCSPCNDPNWGEETNSKNAQNSSQRKSAANDRDPNVETDNNLSCAGSKWGGKANVRDATSSWGLPTTKCYPKEPHNTSRNDHTLDHRENTKEASCSSKRISDDKWGYNVKTDNSSSWSKWGDETTTKDAPNSWRSSSTKRDSKKTNSSSAHDPKWEDRASRKNSAGSSQWKSDDDKLGSNVKTDNSSSWPKWPDKATTRDGSNSWRSSPAKSYPKETNNHSSWNAPKCDDRATTKNVSSSLQWRSKADKWGSNVKTDNSSWPERGDETTTEDEPSSWRPSTAHWDSKETSNNSSCNVPKLDDRVTIDDAFGSSQWRSEVDKWGSNVKTGNSSSWTKWGGGITAKDEPNSWRSSTCKSDSKETSNDSSWNTPKWDDRETTKEALGSSRSNVDKWGSNAKSHNSSSWPKWGDKTTTNDIHNSSKSGANADDRQGSLWPKRGADTTNKDTQNSSQWRRNADRQGSDVKTDNISSWPKWGDDTANNGRQGSNVKIDNSSSWPKWGADSTNNDVHNSSQWRANYDRQDSNVKTDYSSLGNGQKRGDKTTAEDAPNSSWMRANSHRQCSNVETDNSLTMKGTMLGDDDKRATNSMENQKPSWKDRKQDGYRTTKDSPRSSRWRSDGVKQDYSLKISNDGQTITKNFPHSSQYRSYSERKQYDVKANSRLSQTDSKLGDQNMLHEACQMTLPANEQNITQETSQKVQHILKTSQSPSSNHNLTGQNGEDKQNLSTGHCYSHQVGRSKKSLKPFTNEASAGTPTVLTEASAGTPTVLTEPSLRSPSTEPIISDSSNLKHPNVSKESQISPKSLAGTNTLTSCSSNLEGKLQHGKEQNTSRSYVGDHDMMKVGNVNKEDEKAIQLFKFALVEFVKEILRPSWQEGHLSKGAHKTIAKKVVDKVTGTLEGNNIPQTQGEVDRYINSCRTKLTNLVQAYLQIYAGV